MTVLKKREHRQRLSLHAHRGTVRFFHNHPWLARTKAGRRALKVARVWIPVLRRELRETRASLHPDPAPVSNLGAWLCIHRYEGAWNANTGNGYFGGLQMDYSFMRSYGPELLSAKGTADRWTPAEQMMVAERARASRGFSPWPNTARACGLL